MASASPRRIRSRRASGFPRTRKIGARAGIDHVLLGATSEGHCALPLEKLKGAAVKLLEAPVEAIEQALSQMLKSGSLLLEDIDGEPLVFMPHLRRGVDGIAAGVRRLVTARVAYPAIDVEKAMAWCEQRTGKTLAPSQRAALKIVLSNRVAIITGGPGVGKTTVYHPELRGSFSLKKVLPALIPTLSYRDLASDDTKRRQVCRELFRVERR